MGEEEKKPEEKVEEKKEEEAKKGDGEKTEKKEEEKKEENKQKKGAEEAKEGKEEAKEEPTAPPPVEFEYRVFMHCEGCAKKVKRSLRGFPDVEHVITDCKAHKVVVKGKTADPLKVLDRIQRKSHRKVELLTPLPKPPAEEPKKAEEKKDKPKQEEKKEEPPVIIVTLKVHMHCEACAQEIKKRIQRMKGVKSAEPDQKGSQVAVKGVFDPSKLVEYIYKRTGKHAVIVKQESAEKKEEEKGKEEKKDEEGREERKGGEEEEKENKEGAGREEAKGGREGGEGGGGGGEGGSAAEETMVVELKKNEYYPKYTEYVYPPQIFSDDNPNACSVM